MGYGNRTSNGIHDRITARALALEMNGERWALVACDLCYLNAVTVRETRAAIQQRLNIPPRNVFLATVHTHSGPHDRDADNWQRPLAELIADAVEAAVAQVRPALVASGYGVLYGWSINRRWIDRPVDPGVAVIRVDSDDGTPMGLVANFACHAVVMGPDNLQISADWPGAACTKLEAALGSNSICLFLQGGAGNINPLVANVRAKLQSGQTVHAIGDISSYYGPADSPDRYNIGNRTGGTFEEVAELGDAFAEEVLHVARGLRPTTPVEPLWSKQVVVKAAAAADEALPVRPMRSQTVADYERLAADGIPAEIMLLSIGDALLVGQPGEVFSETAVTLKARLRALHYRTPMLVTYANGWISYLPEPEDFPEGGYEVSRAYGMGVSRDFQPHVWQALQPVFENR
jgi:hypothetical protein